MRLVIQGQVFRSGRPLGGAQVTFLTQEPKAQAVMGEATTGEDGRYRWTHKPEGAAPKQVLVRAAAGGQTLAETTVVLDRPVHTVNLEVSAEELSEYERLESALSELFSGKLPEVLSPQQTVEIAEQTGFAQGAIQAYMGARGLHRGRPSVPAEVFYALMRDGQLKGLGDLSLQRPDIASALKGALDRRTVPAHLKEKIAAAEAELTRMHDEVRAVGAGRLVSTLGEGVPEAIRQKLRERVAAHGGPLGHLWHSLREDPGFQAPEVRAEVSFVLKLAEVTGSNLSLLEGLQRRRMKGEHPARALANLSESEWAELVRASLANGEAIPDHIPGEEPSEREQHYAARVRETFAAAFATDMVAAALKREAQLPAAAAQVASATLERGATAGEGPAPHRADLLTREARMFPGFDPDKALDQAGESGVVRNPIREGAVRFFDQAPDFDLTVTQIDQYLRQHGERVLDGIPEENRGHVTAFLKRLQRAFQVTPRYDQIKELLGEGLDSAVAISSIGAEAFVTRFGGVLGGEESARRVHSRARFVTAMTTSLYGTVHQAINDVTPMALGGPSLAATLREQFPTWNSLFGRSDLCDCPHCRSVYSPAAYLTDLLHYLAPTEPPLGYTLDTVPLDFLRRRRPDLEQLLLTCENTNTTLPYVDLVNEVLESYVDRGAAVVNNTSKGATEESLSVHREYGAPFVESISDNAYSQVAAAVYPFTLPFDRNLEVVRSFLGHLGSSRFEAMRTFRRADWREAEATESLGLSPTDRAIFRERTPHQLWELYGYASDYVTTPGLLGQYYPNTTMTGAPFVRLDPVVKFDWGGGSPAPAVPITDFSAVWTARFVAPATGTYTFYTFTDDGVRLYVNGALLIDKWILQGATEWSAQVNLQQGVTYDLRMEYYEHQGAAVAQLHCAGPNLPKQAVGPNLVHVRRYWTDDLKWIPTFLQRTGITFEELVDLLSTRFINPNPSAPTVRIQFQGDPTNLDTSYLEGLRDGGDWPLHRIHRFLRLWRRVGGTMADLDLSLMTLGRHRRRFLRRYADALRLKADLAASFGADLPLQALISLWSDLNTHGADAYYLSLFQNKAVFSPLDPDFALKADRTGPVGVSATITSKAPLLLAALRLTPPDLAAIRAHTGLAGNQTITLGHLSLLQRYALLARTLRLAVPELILLERLTNINPFANPDQTAKFVMVLKGIRAAGFTVSMLQYLLTGEAPAGSSLAPSAAAVTSLCNSLQTGLARIQQESAPPGNPSAMQLREFLAALLTPEAASVAVQLAEGTAPGTNTDKAAFIAAQLTFLPLAQAEALLLAPLGSDPEQSRLERRNFIATHAGARIQATLSRTLVLRTLSDNLGLTEAMAEVLTEQVLRSAAGDPSKPALTDLMSPAAAAFVPTYHRLYKVAQLVKALRLTTEEVAYVQAHGADFAGLDFNLWPADAPVAEAQAETLFTYWEQLRMLAAARRDLPPAQGPLVDMFTVAKETGSTLQGVTAVLAKLTGWNPTTLAYVCGPAGLGLSPGQFGNAAVLERVRAAMELVARTGVPAEALIAWGTTAASAAQARSVRETVKAKYDEKGWLKAALPVSERLRGLQRDALVAYVLTLPAIRNQAITNANQLFEYFLLDTQMDPTIKTTRIKQAISSVQLFVQRCFLNLEPDVPLYLMDLDIWEWMKNYRVWEANRKVFLYPENWIEPDLRRDKTPLFKELEEALMQGEVNEENVERALRKYLEGMVELSRLEVVAVAKEYAGWMYGGWNYHVIGRSAAAPRTYYHRRYVKGVWQPWERLDLDIQGDHLFLWYNGTLQLYWPTFEKVTDPISGSIPQSQNPRYRWEIKLAFSEFKHGKWTPRRVINQPLRSWYLDEVTWTQPDISKVESINFRGESTSASVNDRWVPAFRIVASAWRPQNDENFREIGSFLILKGISEVRVESGWWVYHMPVPPESRFYHSHLKADSAWQLVVPTRGRFYYETTTPYTTVLGKASPYRLAYVSDWGLRLNAQTPFVYQDAERTYLAAPVLENEINRKFMNLFHPFGEQFLAGLNGGSVSDFYRNTLTYQRLNNDGTVPASKFNTLYQPGSTVLTPYPREAVDFSYGGAYATYNWELFFHVPLLIATRLGKEQRFEEAQRWFHYIFNPTVNSSDPVPQRYWRFLPFHENLEDERISRLLTALADPNADPELREEAERQVAQWQENPFDPHLIGRLRLSAYQKAVVMKYVDNLIAWADYRFGQNTLESINEATQLYVLAYNLLGPKPERIPELAVPLPRSFAQLRPGLDDFSNALAEVQNRYPFVVSGSGGGGSGGASGLGLGYSLYFGIPRNDKLLSYWDTVEDRLYKIRHGLSLEGIAQTLPLFDSPLDPAMMVRASAMGVSLSGALSDLNAPLGHYRFSYMLAKAAEFCQEVRSLGGALLLALEKKDAEALAALRAGQESSLLQLARDVRVQQIKEAKSVLDGLRKTRAVTEYRYNHYRNLAFLNPFEQAHLGLTATSALLQAGSQASDLAASVARMIPEIDLGVSGISSPVAKARFGGSNVAGALEAFSKYLNIGASLAYSGATLSAAMGGHHRRAEEWRLQENVAQRELAQIDKQMLTAEIRIALAELELRNHDKQVENARTVEQFLQDKYTNQELYNWMVTQTSALYFQAYQMAYNLAKRAERAFRFERGLTSSNYVQFGHWDSLKKGLLAGERLALDLRRLEMAHLEQNAREYEVSKRVSLMMHDPMALIGLKQTGRCEFRLPEALFDMDYPGHYFRRIKSVSVTIPCVTGPYTGIHGTLTLLSSEIRTSNAATGSYPRSGDDPRFLVDFSAVQSIATSHAQEDTGLFELSFRDERYLPFEGAGAISHWRLELPPYANAFDFDTISDVIITLRYTSREGGALLGQTALASLTLPEPEGQAPSQPAAVLPAQPALQRMFSLRHEFPTEWHRFFHPAETAPAHAMGLQISRERFPYRFRSRNPQVSQVEIFLLLKDGVAYDGAPLRISLRPAGASGPETADLVAAPAFFGGTPHGTVAGQSRSFGLWEVAIQRSDLASVSAALREVDSATGQYRLKAEAIEDLVLVYHYATT